MSAAQILHIVGSSSVDEVLESLRMMKTMAERDVADIETAIRIVSQVERRPKGDPIDEPKVLPVRVDGAGMTAREIRRRRATEDAPAQEEESPEQGAPTPPAVREKATPSALSGVIHADTDEQVMATITRSGRFLFAEQLAKELERSGVEKGWKFSDLLKKLAAQGRLAKAQYGTSRRFTAYGLPEWTKVVDGERTIERARHAAGIGSAYSATVELAGGAK